MTQVTLVTPFPAIFLDAHACERLPEIDPVASLASCLDCHGDAANAR